MITSWNDEEDEALQGLPLAAQVLYLRGLRRHMDYVTGIVGRRRRISWPMLREIAEVEPHQGVTDSGKPSMGRVRRLLDRLIRAGLVEDIGPKRRGDSIVFRLPLATTGSVRVEKTRHEPGMNPACNTRHEPGMGKNDNRQSVMEFGDAKPGMNPACENDSLCHKPGTHLVQVQENPQKHDLYFGHPDAEIPPKSRPAARFDDFWAAYPRKVGKKTAREKWKTRRLDEQADMIIADIEARKRRHRPWLDGYIPNPTTYLNGERWDDEIIESRPADRQNRAESRADANRQAAEAFLSGKPVRTPRGALIEGTLIKGDNDPKKEAANA